ncbi:MAG: spore cortex-lytic enzyme [Clostridia bacterium]|nr:spore cortex-lytic enzyme [Clostridia bacterium]
MNKRKKILTALALSFAFTCMAVAIVYSVYNTANNTAFYAVAEDVLTLKQGSRGETVKKIQQKLKRWGYYSGAVDGIFGSQTRKAVVLFQKRNGLVADGIVGKRTFQALGISTSSNSSSSSTSQGVNGYTSSDVALLARLIHAEARGESYTGQVAVGAVVLNRVRSSSFPNTISAVVYQPYAFTCVNDGQINLSPNQTAFSAAKDAMNGWDPSYGSLYYYNPAIATSKWIFSRKTVVTIGKHVFAI